jgi:hypothetical protein
MKIRQIHVLLVVTASLVGCNNSSQSTTPQDEPMPPILSGIVVQQDDPIFVRVSMPFSKWEVDKTKPTDVAYGRAYVRVNGHDHKCSHDMAPFGSTAMTLELSRGLSEPPSWAPGTYHVSYVLKDVMAVHRDDSSHKRHIEELASDEITITIIEKKDS